MKRKTTINEVSSTTNGLTCQVKIWLLVASWILILLAWLERIGLGIVAWGCWVRIDSMEEKAMGLILKMSCLRVSLVSLWSCLANLLGIAGRGWMELSSQLSWGQPWRLLRLQSTSCWCPWGRSVAAAGPCTCTLWRGLRSPGTLGRGRRTCRSSGTSQPRWSILTCPLKNQPGTKENYFWVWILEWLRSVKVWAWDFCGSSFVINPYLSR